MRAGAPPPHAWLDGLARALDARLAGVGVLSAISGAGWVSLRTEAGFVWLLAHAGLRLAWWSERPLPRAWLDLLDRHQKSPFATHLAGARVESVRLLRTEDGQDDGIEFALAPGERRLRARFFPRPGAIWLEDAASAEIARAGRMDGPPLRAHAGKAALELEAHRRECESVLESALADRCARVLRQRAEQVQARARRTLLALEAEAEQAESDRGLRRHADLLAANLHAVRAGAASIDLIDFEGEHRTIELDPALAPHANLDRWYRRAARAERKVEQVVERLEQARDALEAANRTVERVSASDGDLDEWLALAEELGLDPRADARTPASERGRPDPRRLPYWSYRLDGFELRVGRSAKDNDELTRRHADGRDLWLHAQGVAGSHVVLRSGGRPVAERTIERAASVAAHFSRSRTSALVPVLVVERRYVRKPRKAPPGQVAVERARTVFAEPAIPEGCEREDD